MERSEAELGNFGLFQIVLHHGKKSRLLRVGTLKLMETLILSRLPGHVHFDNPEAEGLPGSRNFYLESEPGVQLGVWQILPADIQVTKGEYSEREHCSTPDVFLNPWSFLSKGLRAI